MNSMLLFEAIGEIDEKFIKDAKSVSFNKKKITAIVISVAASFILFFFIPNIPNFFGMGAQEGDIFRNGYLIEDISISELSEYFDGNLLAKNLIGDGNFEFYSKTENFSSDINNWYSLLYSEYNTDSKILMHCMFGEDKENWKIDTVFTDDSTKAVVINGTLVEIADFQPSLNYQYTFYAIFQKDGVVYDLRVYSNSSDTVYNILESLLK